MALDKFVINGGNRLKGEVQVSGAKNSALPILAASLLTEGTCTISGVPDLADTRAMGELLGDLGASVSREENGRVHVRVADERQSHARYDRVRKMRASICVLGPLLAKRKGARVAMPGGCAIGSRPVNLHLRGLRALGAQIELDGGDIVAVARKLRGAEIFLGGPFGSTVLGTANVMMAATLAEGRTVIESAACEPEIADLAAFLNAMGAKVSGAGTPRFVIDGVEQLSGAEHRIIPDRIEAGTFMIAAAITNGEINLPNVRVDHMMAVVDKLREVGVIIDKADGGAVVSTTRHLEPTDATTQPFPGFPTDLQAQLTSLLCLAEGNSAITEKVFPDRFMHVAELLR
ncbi:MAG: UDP-N-acetylglucosamine 1-carboxyvinyltransferase, partial [Phycisphaerae bacterium]|nr:UDP-N-acetylglucosamine 1-carboxyvinyltransferase [Phycisphaerae bacterium]